MGNCKGREECVPMKSAVSRKGNPCEMNPTCLVDVGAPNHIPTGPLKLVEWLMLCKFMLVSASLVGGALFPIMSREGDDRFNQRARLSLVSRVIAFTHGMLELMN